jgi:co-chaperonin GroES (HSP10)
MDVSKIQAQGPWVLVKVDDPPKKSKAGIYLPVGNLEERLGHITGTVLSVGPGHRGKGGSRIPTDINVGDKVLFRGYLQEANRPGGVIDREHCLINIDDIVGVVERE